MGLPTSHSSSQGTYLLDLRRLLGQTPRKAGAVCPPGLSHTCLQVCDTSGCRHTGERGILTVPRKKPSPWQIPVSAGGPRLRAWCLAGPRVGRSPRGRHRPRGAGAASASTPPQRPGAQVAPGAVCCSGLPPPPFSTSPSVPGGPASPGRSLLAAPGRLRTGGTLLADAVKQLRPPCLGSGAGRRPTGVCPPASETLKGFGELRAGGVPSHSKAPWEPIQATGVGGPAWSRGGRKHMNKLPGPRRGSRTGRDGPHGGRP